MSRVVGVLVVAAALLGLSGCGGGDPGTGPSQGGPSSPGPTGEIGIPPGETPGSPGYSSRTRPVSVTLARTGGIAGVHDKVAVAPEGAWSYTGSAGTQSGQLADRQVSKLQSLALDGRLRAEAERSGKGGETPHCADGLQYTLQAGSLSMTAVDCGGFPGRPAFSALVEYVGDVTPM